MTILERVSADERAAVKSRDDLIVQTLRLLRSSLHNEEIALRLRPLPDPETIKVIRREMKRREDAVEAYTKGGRADRAQTEARELELLKRYLPPQLSSEELSAVVERVIVGSGAKDFGRVMKAVMAEVGDRVSGKAVSDLVRKTLANS